MWLEVERHIRKFASVARNEIKMATHIRWKKIPLIVSAIIAVIFCLSILINIPHSSIKDVKLITWEEPNVVSNKNLPGEGGKPVLTPIESQDESRISYEEYGFNQYISDKISLHRSLLDVRPVACHYEKFPSILPKVSVIIIFHNEGWSTLLRTVHSVINRSPPSLLHEIILCDDFSTKAHLKEKLENYIAGLPKVKLVRTKEREGLIRAKNMAADSATGEVLLFLDAHCEANAGWLPPLLAEISRDYRAVVCPTIDVIAHKDFSYIASEPFKRGTFNWKFDYKEKILTADDFMKRRNEAQPILSPVMAGGLFAISRKFWLELGKYDPGMYVWGGEQYELSFKLWMCGGKMMNLPCSRVGHVYRDKVPYKSNKMNAALINFKRVAEVWMDEFKQFLYHNRLDIEIMPPGDISQRKALRKSLKCKDFRWYLDNVANETVRTRFEPDRGDGHIRHIERNVCIDIKGRYGSALSLSPCEDKNEQTFKWTYINEFRRGLEDCLDAVDNDFTNIYLQRCHEDGRNQVFRYLKKTQQILHESSRRCLSSAEDGQHIILEPCDEKSTSQRWEIKLNDMNQPVPEWAKIAETLQRYHL